MERKDNDNINSQEEIPNLLSSSSLSPSLLPWPILYGSEGNSSRIGFSHCKIVIVNFVQIRPFSGLYHSLQGYLALLFLGFYAITKVT